MRRIERTNAFRLDFRREKKGRHRSELQALLLFAASLLVRTGHYPKEIATIGWGESGTTIGSATLGLICC
jgi:hypothetical protein